MVTITDATWDDDRLLELTQLMGLSDRGELMVAASVAACYAVVSRQARLSGAQVSTDAKAVALQHLWACRPAFPCGWASDTDLEWEVENDVMLRLGDAAIEVVLTAAECDGKNASRLAGWADEHARRMGPNYCAPSFDDGYVSVDAVKQFIEDWRDAFMIKLHRIAEATEGASRR